jgi:hypothetical protein
MLFHRFTRAGLLGLWAASALPTAFAAISWDTCTTDATGGKICTRRIPRSARLAIAVCCLMVLLLLLGLVIYIIVKRRRAQGDQEYNVEAAQVEGPPTIIATEYNPTSGPSRIYSAGPNGHETGNKDQQAVTGPTHPESAYQSERPPTYTAPASRVMFADQSYPFAYDARNTSEPPKTAFVSNGFPRPLLAGNRLKDRLKERPMSASGLNVPVPPHLSTE